MIGDVHAHGSAVDDHPVGQARRTTPASRLVVGAIRIYQQLRTGRPTGCRYLPTCSTYAVEAVQHFGVVRGLWLASRRLSRCHPWGGQGIDPVPDRSGACPH
jgi:hypothetical protein